MKIPIFIFATALICGFKAEQVLVKTKLGGIQGQVETAINSEKRYAAFTSVPYAKPPVGNLRFKDPQMASAWQGTLEATGKSPQCPQLGLDPQKLTQNPEDLEGQEDCLYLNIAVPVPKPNNSAIMVRKSILGHFWTLLGTSSKKKLRLVILIHFYRFGFMEGLIIVARLVLRCMTLRS